MLHRPVLNQFAHLAAASYKPQHVVCSLLGVCFVPFQLHANAGPALSRASCLSPAGRPQAALLLMGPGRQPGACGTERWVYGGAVSLALATHRPSETPCPHRVSPQCSPVHKQQRDTPVSSQVSTCTRNSPAQASVPPVSLPPADKCVLCHCVSGASIPQPTNKSPPNNNHHQQNRSAAVVCVQ